MDMIKVDTITYIVQTKVKQNIFMTTLLATFSSYGLFNFKNSHNWVNENSNNRIKIDPHKGRNQGFSYFIN